MEEAQWAESDLSPTDERLLSRRLRCGIGVGGGGKIRIMLTL